MELFESATKTASGTGTPYHQSSETAQAEFLLNVTAAATAAGDKLDVYVQASVDLGTTWDDFVRFTQVLGDGGAKKYLVRWQGRIAPTTAQAAPQDAAMAAGVAAGPHGLYWRVKYVITSASAPSFTFSVWVGGGVRRQS